MEVMQIGPAAFGQQLGGPGIGSTGGCVFECSIGRGAFQRISKDNKSAAEKAMVVDAATAFSERMGEIGHYKLLARHTIYTNKITDEIVSEKTLVSPDFNYEAAGVWTSAGESGTVGTISEYQSTVDRAKELAQVDGDASMFWVSPSASGDIHRAYLWVKKGEEVDAYQYILPGSRKAVSDTVKTLGYQGNARLLEDQTILQKGKEQRIHHKDIYKALASSLSYQEAEKVKPILEKFRQEVEIPDDTRKERLKTYQKEYEAQLNSEKLKKVYEKDIEKWLQSVAQGFAAINRIGSSDGIKESIANGESLISEQTKRDDLAYLDYQRMQNSKDKLEKKETFFRALQPIIPGLIGLTGIFDEYSKHVEIENMQKIGDGEEYVEDNDKIVRNPNNKIFSDQISDKGKPGELFGITVEDKTLSDSMVWQEFISIIFQPPDRDLDSSHSVDKEEVVVLSEEVFTTWEKGLPEVLLGFVPPQPIDEFNEIRESPKTEKLTIIVSDFQQGLESISQLISAKEAQEIDGGKIKQGKERQILLEMQVVQIGEEMVKRIFFGENKLQVKSNKELIPNLDPLIRLSFLLNVYKDENSREEIKPILVTLIYKQIQEIQQNREFVSNKPQLLEIFEKFQKLSPHVSFLDHRYDLLLFALQNEYLSKIFDEDISEKLRGDTISQLIFAIYNLGKRTGFRNVISNHKQLLFSFERLPRVVNLIHKQSISLLQQNKTKRRKSNPSAAVIIFLFEYGIIYQYCRYLSRQVYICQNERRDLS
ncbi:hypothetical protein HY029_05510 [Candidatus Gottesmanbacteria bacterium]|nr:hypothetical protein [Candidatus Gottesmanbacteria bacterium]